MWLHKPMPNCGNMLTTDAIIRKHKLNTVCEEAKCPNRHICYSNKTAAFLALGRECTRACPFCDIDFSKTPLPPNEEEAEKIVLSIKELGLEHAVITMVSRDDLADGGASHIAKIISSIRKETNNTTIEVLTSDFNGDTKSIEKVVNEKPEIYNHNIETVRRLTPKVRFKATYDVTLQVLKHAKKLGKACFVKSGFMLGFGEEQHEVEETIRDLKEVGCDAITIGQYMQPTKFKLRVKSFVKLDEFKYYEDYGHRIGLKYVYSGPFVRSSFNAKQIFQKLRG